MHGKEDLKGSVCKKVGFCAREGRFEGVGVQIGGILCTGYEIWRGRCAKSRDFVHGKGILEGRCAKRWDFVHGKEDLKG